MLGRLTKLADRHGVRRAVQFGLAGVVGFLAAEVIIVAGLFVVYGDVQVPSGFSTSPLLLTTDVVAFAVGVTVGFFVNERTTVRETDRRGSLLVRLAKYQAVYVLGNAITIGTQLVLLAALGLSPAVGVLVGAVVAFPASYFASMRFVWNV